MLQEILLFIEQHPLLSSTWVLLLVAVTYLTVRMHLSPVKDVTCLDAVQLINKEEAVVIDLRSHEQYRQGHILHSMNVTPTVLQKTYIEQLEKHKQQPIIMVCTNGMSARSSGEMLYKAGFKRVFALKEGIFAWQNAKLPLISGK